MENQDYLIIPNKKTSWQISIWLVLLLIAIAFGGGVFLSDNFFFKTDRSVVKGTDSNINESMYGDLQNSDEVVPEYLTKDVDFNLFWNVWDLVKEKYYEKNIPETQLFYGALSGIVASLNDPYSIFMTAEDTDDFQEELDGNFEGIGAEIGIRNNILTVISPLSDHPAIKAGLKAKDLILKIDGEDTVGMSLTEAVKKIRGSRSTEVVLTIYREGFSEAQDFVVVRDEINVKSLSWEFKENIAYIKIRQFNDATIPLFNDAIIDISQRGNISGIILDLRNNPGGYLQSAIDMAGEWIDGEVVVIEKRRDGIQIDHRSNKKARLGDYNTVVLINAGTASGSEIVAGALQDFGKATIIGENSFGKGSVQDLTKLKDGSSIKLTIAKWFTPNGKSIEDNGIYPDVKLELTEDDYNNFNDPQLEKAFELLK